MSKFGVDVQIGREGGRRGLVRGRSCRWAAGRWGLPSREGFYSVHSNPQVAKFAADLSPFGDQKILRISLPPYTHYTSVLHSASLRTLQQMPTDWGERVW